MIKLRPSAERGHFNMGWLDTHHTFSFGEYHDPKQMGFRSLRVINEDVVQPGEGFGTHPHNDMEIITCVLEGALEHKDSMGNGSIIRPNEIQRMSAGTGVTHSEFNHSKTDPVHLYQIWILPEKKGIKPGYEQKEFLEDKRRDRLCLIASSDGRDGSVKIHQDVDLYFSLLTAGKKIEWKPRPGRAAWIQIARGNVDLNGNLLREGDGAAVSDEKLLTLQTKEKGEFFLFDLN